MLAGFGCDAQFRVGERDGQHRAVRAAAQPVAILLGRVHDEAAGPRLVEASADLHRRPGREPRIQVRASRCNVQVHFDVLHVPLIPLVKRSRSVLREPLLVNRVPDERANHNHELENGCR